MTKWLLQKERILTPLTTSLLKETVNPQWQTEVFSHLEQQGAGSFLLHKQNIKSKTAWFLKKEGPLNTICKNKNVLSFFFFFNKRTACFWQESHKDLRGPFLKQLMNSLILLIVSVSQEKENHYMVESEDQRLHKKGFSWGQYLTSRLTI